MDPELTDLLPHRPPMLLIDRLAAGEPAAATATAVKTFRLGSYGTDGGTVLEPALIECLAQTMAAMKGRQARAEGRAPAFGMLVGVSDFVFHRPARCESELTLTVAVRASLPPFVLAAGQVRQDGELVAEGSLKFFIGGGDGPGG